LELISSFINSKFGNETDEYLKNIIFSLEAFDCEQAQTYITELEDFINENR